MTRCYISRNHLELFLIEVDKEFLFNFISTVIDFVQFIVTKADTKGLFPLTPKGKQSAGLLRPTFESPFSRGIRAVKPVGILSSLSFSSPVSVL